MSEDDEYAELMRERAQIKINPNLVELRKLVGEKIERIEELDMETVDDILPTQIILDDDHAENIKTASGEELYMGSDEYIVQTENNLFIMGVGSCSGEGCVFVKCVTGEVFKHFKRSGRREKRGGE